MRKVVKGIVCDTEVAKFLGCYAGGIGFYRSCENLYRTETGQYFLHGHGEAKTPWKGKKGFHFHLISKEEAERFCEEKFKVSKKYLDD